MHLGLEQAFYLPRLASALGLELTQGVKDHNKTDPIAGPGAQLYVIAPWNGRQWLGIATWGRKYKSDEGRQNTQPMVNVGKVGKLKGWAPCWVPLTSWLAGWSIGLAYHFIRDLPHAFAVRALCRVHEGKLQVVLVTRDARWLERASLKQCPIAVLLSQTVNGKKPEEIPELTQMLSLWKVVQGKWTVTEINYEKIATELVQEKAPPYVAPPVPERWKGWSGDGILYPPKPSKAIDP